SKLWRYNLHYFEYLWVLPPERGSVLMLDWIERHPLDRGREGWEPYPTSLRLLNWCAYHSTDQRDAAIDPRIWSSIYLQAQWLSRHLETHIQANHLLENAVTMAFVGACFDGPDAA